MGQKVGRPKDGRSIQIRLTLPSTATPEMEDFFDKIKAKGPKARLVYLFQLSLGQTDLQEVEVDEDDDIEALLASLTL